MRARLPRERALQWRIAADARSDLHTVDRRRGQLTLSPSPIPSSADRPPMISSTAATGSPDGTGVFGEGHGVLRDSRDRAVGADEDDVERDRRVLHPEARLARRPPSGG